MSKDPQSPVTRRGRGRPALGTRSERTAGRSRLLVAATHHPTTDFLAYRDFLLKLYEFLKEESPAYSYQQLAEDLGFSRSNVIWLVITGRRRLSPSACDRIIKALDLTGVQRRYFKALRAYNDARRADEREAIFQDLVAIKRQTVAKSDAQHALEYFSEWYHPIIRELVGLEDFKSDPEWINLRLIIQLMPMQIHRSLELLEKLGLITYDRKRAKHVPTGGQILPDRDVERMASVRFHQKMCDLARDAITRVTASRREMNTLTVRIGDDVAMKASEILYRACEQIMKLETESKSSGDQIYQINVHLFPLTKTPGGKGE